MLRKQIIIYNTYKEDQIVNVKTKESPQRVSCCQQLKLLIKWVKKEMSPKRRDC